MAASSSDLLPFAARYIWWTRPEDALAMPDRVLAQVMNIGDYDDVLALIEIVGEARLRAVLSNAEIGQFNARSWAYWHYRFELSAPDQLPPPMPRRKISATEFTQTE
jgi:hypothetical protein